jgi:membrane protease YdiL (CAAX protease family)
VSDPENNGPAPPSDNAPGADAAAPLVPQEPALAAPVAAESAVPEDLRAPWSWGGIGIFILVAVGCLVAASISTGIVAAIIFIIKGMKFTTASIEQPPMKALLTTMIQVSWSGMVMLYLALYVRLGYQVPFWRTIGWRPLRAGSFSPRAAALFSLLGGMGMAFVVSLLSFSMRPKTKLPIEEFLNDRWSALLLIGMGFLLAPLVEETIFRGFLYPVFARQFGVPAGIAITGVLFGLLHAAQLRGAPGLLALLIVVGIVLTYVRARAGTVWASYLWHLGYNGFLFLGLVVGTHGLTKFPAGN